MWLLRGIPRIEQNPYGFTLLASGLSIMIEADGSRVKW